MGAEPLPPPLSLDTHDIELLSDAVDVVMVPGKGRGLVVNEDIECSSLLLCEEASLPFDEDDMGATVRTLIRDVIIPWANREDPAPLAKLLLLCPADLQHLPAEQKHAVSYVEEFCKALATREAEEAHMREAAYRHTDLLKLLAVKVAMNSFASGVFLYLSMLNHSCCANCEVVHEGGTTHILTNRNVKAGEELTIRYAPAEELEARYGFKCDCGACDRNPTHTRREQSILNRTCERQKDIAKLMRGLP